MNSSSCAVIAPRCCGNVTPPSEPVWHAGFLKLLPAICRQARHYFRHLDCEALEEAIAEVAANAMIAYCRLVELDKADIAYAAPLANFACRQYAAGRRVGVRQNSQEISSPGCQRRHHFTILGADDWRELADQRRSTPAEIASARIDFADWLETLEPRDRRLVKTLAGGESTKDAARSFRISAGRISQLRRELAAKWRRFVEPDVDEPVTSN